MGAMSEEIPRLLCQVHSRVCRRLQHETGLAAPVGQNAKGDTQQRFDVVADAVIRRALRESFGSGIILSEESDAVQFGEAPRAIDSSSTPWTGRTTGDVASRCPP